jgi:hypothetical protein
MKILFLCQLMSPLLLTRRNWSPLQAFAPGKTPSVFPLDLFSPRFYFMNPLVPIW